MIIMKNCFLSTKISSSLIAFIFMYIFIFRTQRPNFRVNPLLLISTTLITEHYVHTAHYTYNSKRSTGSSA